MPNLKDINLMCIIAFGSVPKDGGTFTFYRNLRPALLEYGIDMRCVTLGREQSYLWEDAYADEGCILLASDTGNVKKQAMAFADWCESEGVDIVMGINSEAILSSLPHLPEKIRVMARCANAFDHGYRITLACAERLARVIALTPRLEYDLINTYGADSSIMHLIPNGIDPEKFNGASICSRGCEKELRLSFLGRLEHKQKGVFYIPEIVRELNRLNVPFHLRIAGKGKHRSVIESQMENEVKQGQVEFVGAITPDEVACFLAETDVFVFTSHFEGCPNSLLEAMMAGCVPVSWLIDGITDYIIDDGRTGVICSMGESKAFARKISELCDDRDKLKAMGINAAQEARLRFTPQIAAAEYAAVFNDVMSTSAPSWVPVPWNAFKRDPNFEHSWTELIPTKLRLKIKKIIHRS